MGARAGIAMATPGLLFMLVSAYFHVQIFTSPSYGAPLAGLAGSLAGLVAAILLLLGLGAYVIGLVFYGVAYLVSRGARSTMLSYMFKAGALLSAVNGAALLYLPASAWFKWRGSAEEALILIAWVSAYFAVAYLLYRAGANRG